MKKALVCGKSSFSNFWIAREVRHMWVTRGFGMWVCLSSPATVLLMIIVNTHTHKTDDCTISAFLYFCSSVALPESVFLSGYSVWDLKELLLRKMMASFLKMKAVRSGKRGTLTNSGILSHCHYSTFCHSHLDNFHLPWFYYGISIRPLGRRRVHVWMHVRELVEQGLSSQVKRKNGGVCIHMCMYFIQTTYVR